MAPHKTIVSTIATTRDESIQHGSTQDDSQHTFEKIVQVATLVKNSQLTGFDLSGELQEGFNKGIQLCPAVVGARIDNDH